MSQNCTVTPNLVFWAKTKRTAHRRYEAVLALRKTYVAATPEVDAVFASLERHWPTLVNAIESDRYAVGTSIPHWEAFAAFLASLKGRFHPNWVRILFATLRRAAS